MIFYASLFYFLCALLFPDDIKEYAGYEDYFLSRRSWFFGILALTAIADVVDTLFKGVDYFNSFGFEYPAQTIVTIALCLVAMATRSQLFHGAFVAAMDHRISVSWMSAAVRSVTASQHSPVAASPPPRPRTAPRCRRRRSASPRGCRSAR